MLWRRDELNVSRTESGTTVGLGKLNVSKDGQSGTQLDFKTSHTDQDKRLSGWHHHRDGRYLPRILIKVEGHRLTVSIDDLAAA